MLSCVGVARDRHRPAMSCYGIAERQNRCFLTFAPIIFFPHLSSGFEIIEEAIA